MPDALDFDEDDLRACCPQEEFLQLDFGHKVRWRSVGLYPNACRISRAQIAINRIKSGLKQLVFFLGILSTIVGSLIGIGAYAALASIYSAMFLLVSIPVSIVLTFIAFFVVNFHSQFFVDRVRSAQDVSIDYKNQSITWKTWTGTYAREFRQLKCLSIELVSKQIDSTGVALSMHFDRGSFTVLETSTFCKDLEQTRNLLVPFAERLAKSLGTSVVYQPHSFESIDIVRRRDWSMIFFLACICCILLFYVLDQAFTQSQVAWFALLNLVWLLPCLSLNLFCATRIHLNRKLMEGSIWSWRRNHSIDLKMATQIRVKKVRRRKQGSGHYITYSVFLDSIQTNGSPHHLLIESASTSEQIILIALRLSKFLSLPIDDQSTVIAPSETPLENMI